MPTSFDQVHLPPHTIDSVRTIVSLPLLHPAAFQQGILKQHAMTGCLLFGPPGTGKTSTIKYLPGRTLVIDVDRTTNVLSGEENIDIVYADINDVEVGFAKMLEEIHDEHIQNYDNIVIDNLSELEQAWLGEKAKKSKTKDGRALMWRSPLTHSG